LYKIKNKFGSNIASRLSKSFVLIYNDPELNRELFVFLLAGESIASPVLESSSGGNQEATSTKESNDPAPSAKPNICPDDSTTSTRRSRIKPSVTPSTRTRNNITSRGSKTTSQETQEICPDTIEITASGRYTIHQLV
jgi:hypothetical protein